MTKKTKSVAKARQLQAKLPKLHGNAAAAPMSAAVTNAVSDMLDGSKTTFRTKDRLYSCVVAVSLAHSKSLTAFKRARTCMHSSEDDTEVPALKLRRRKFQELLQTGNADDELAERWIASANDRARTLKRDPTQNSIRGHEYEQSNRSGHKDWKTASTDIEADKRAKTVNMFEDSWQDHLAAVSMKTQVTGAHRVTVDKKCDATNVYNPGGFPAQALKKRSNPS